MSWQLPVFLGAAGSRKSVANLQLEGHTFGQSVAPDDRTPTTFPADLWGSLLEETRGRAVGKRGSACLTRDSAATLIRCYGYGGDGYGGYGLIRLRPPSSAIAPILPSPILLPGRLPSPLCIGGLLPLTVGKSGPLGTIWRCRGNRRLRIDNGSSGSTFRCRVV